jgi:hypothetical protein
MVKENKNKSKEELYEDLVAKAIELKEIKVLIEEEKEAFARKR